MSLLVIGETARKDLQGLKDEAYRQGLKDAAKVAKAHAGSAERSRLALKHDLGPAVLAEIRSEERGETIAAHMIAKAILALIPKP